MPEFSTRVLETLRSFRLLTRRDRVVIGVSGGVDSIVLLHVLAGLRDQYALRLSVAHVHHGLRPDADADAAFVTHAAARYGVPVTVSRKDAQAEAARFGLSLEDAARRVRYDAFTDAVNAFSADRLALAHTADDQAETVLMRLLRGSGLTGLAGIPITRPLGDAALVRPLLNVWRRDVLEYARAERLAFREDPSNQDSRFTRNRLRHELLPLLERDYNPQIKPLLNQVAGQARTDQECLQGAAQRVWKRLVKARGRTLAISRERLASQPAAIQRQIVRLAVQRLQGDLTGFEFRHWLEIEHLVHDRPAGTVVDLPGGIQFERTRDHIVAQSST